MGLTIPGTWIEAPLLCQPAVDVEQGSADSRLGQRVGGFSASHDPRFGALIAAAACSQVVDVYHVKNRIL